jgi:putative transposase
MIARDQLDPQRCSCATSTVLIPRGYAILSLMSKLNSLPHLLLTSHDLWLDALRFIRLTLQPNRALVAENLFLRKQLALYLERKVKPHRASDATRLILVLLYRMFAWRQALTIVKPDTSIRWHRRLSAVVEVEIEALRTAPDPYRAPKLIAKMANENPTLGRGAHCA